MELTLKPSPKNTFPFGGILVKGDALKLWVKEIQFMNLSLYDIGVYPIPNTIPNSIWGCLIIPIGKIDRTHIGKHELCQKVAPTLFIPERSTLHPSLAASDIEKLFTKAIHILHPEFGLVELTEPLKFDELFLEPTIQPLQIVKPHPSVFMPRLVKNFQIQPVSPEEVLKNMEQTMFPKKEEMPEKPLNIFEKGKLEFYKLFFTKEKTTPGTSSNPSEKTGLMTTIQSMLQSFSKKGSKWLDNLQEDFEDLEKRNQKQIDKLMDLFKTNPLEALK